MRKEDILKKILRNLRIISVFIIVILDLIIIVLYNNFSKLFDYFNFLNESAPIGWSITIFGFTVTARNLVFTRRNDKFLNVSMNIILDGNVSGFDKLLWYIILMMPINMIIFYLLHSKKCLWLFVLISLISMLMYFHSVLKRVNGQECLKEISNNIQSFLIQNNKNDFTNSIIKEVSNSNSSFELLSIEKEVNDGLFKILITKPSANCILSTFTEYYTYKLLKHKDFENNILNNITEYSYFNTLNISKISLYDFSFISWIDNKYADFDKKLMDINNKGVNQKFILIEKYILKYLFGIYLAAFINFDLSYNKKIYRNLLNDKRFENFPLTKQKIKAVILLAINYSILNQLSEYDFFESNCNAIFSMFSDNITVNDFADLKNDIFNKNELNVERFAKQNYNICDVLNLMENQLKNEFSIRLLYGTKYVNLEER